MVQDSRLSKKAGYIHDRLQVCCMSYGLDTTSAVYELCMD
jgi:hypothetical protein